MPGEELCAVDFVQSVLLQNFKGKTDIDTLEKQSLKHASEDFRAVLACFGGFRSFLREHGEIFIIESEHVSLSEERRPAKETDVVKWLRGRLKTSPRKIFSITSLEKIVRKKGPPGIRSYFALSCSSIDKIREWFIQRTQVFKETPAGNITLQELGMPLSGANPLWSTIDFFVKILDEQDCDTLSIDFCCLYNYIHVCEMSVVFDYVSKKYEESTFEKFFRDNLEQFGLELNGSTLERCEDPANSGQEAKSSCSVQLTAAGEVENFALGVQACREILKEKGNQMPVVDLQKTLRKDSSLSGTLDLTTDRFIEFLEKNLEHFELTGDRQLVQLKSTASTSAGESSSNESKRNLKLDKSLTAFFKDMLVLAKQWQGLKQVEIEMLCRCVHFLPKHVLTYITHTYQPVSQFFKTSDQFRLNKDQTTVTLREVVPVADLVDDSAEATLTLNFFVKALIFLQSQSIEFVKPAQLESLFCLMNPVIRNYVRTSFPLPGSVKFLLTRFPDIFGESRAGDLFLKDPNYEFDPANETLIKIKAVCSHPYEGSAVEFFLYVLEDIKSQCSPVPLTWCQAQLSKASKSVASYIDEFYAGPRLGEFFSKFPSIFVFVPDVEVVFLAPKRISSNDDGTEQATEIAGIEGRGQYLLGLVAIVCFSNCTAVMPVAIKEAAKRCLIRNDIDDIISGATGRTKSEKVQSMLAEKSAVIAQENGQLMLQWPVKLSQELVLVVEKTLCMITDRLVMLLYDTERKFPSIMSVYEKLLELPVASFGKYLRTMPNFFDFLDKFSDVFLVDGSRNTIINRSFATNVTLNNGAPLNWLKSESANQHHLSMAMTVDSAGRTLNYDNGQINGDMRRIETAPDEYPGINLVNNGTEPIKIWAEEKRFLMTEWSIMAPLVGRFVAKMDLRTCTDFSRVHLVADELDQVLGEVERYCHFWNSEAALLLINSYQEKNVTYFQKLHEVANKVVAFIVDGNKCRRHDCGCQNETRLTDFESLIEFCQSVRVHLEGGPFPGNPTPSECSSSTPEILKRFAQWSYADPGQFIEAIVKSESIPKSEIQNQILTIADVGLWGVSVSPHGDETWSPADIWQPYREDLYTGSLDNRNVFRVSAINEDKIMAQGISNDKDKLTIKWPGKVVRLRDELIVTVRTPKRRSS